MIVTNIADSFSVNSIKFLGLQNDHKALMKEIEKSIHEIHAQAREKKENEKEALEEKTVEGL